VSGEGVLLCCCEVLAESETDTVLSVSQQSVSTGWRSLVT
jgi:hypothetical protein